MSVAQRYLPLLFVVPLSLAACGDSGTADPDAGNSAGFDAGDPIDPDAGPGDDRMQIGTNFFYLAPGWTGELPWVADVPADPWTNGFDPWNPAFIDDVAMYRVIRPMQWNAINPQRDNGNPIITHWSERLSPDDPINFSSNDIGTSQGPGLAYEWQVQLANRLGADLWINVPVRANDEFFVQLATLLRDQLDAGRTVYVELCNEVWNYAGERAYATERARALGLERPDAPDDDFGAAMRWQAYRSAQLWSAFEQVWGDDAGRVINVLAGWSTNPWMTDNLHLGPLFEEAGFNPTGALPEAYAIAPYFGGNGLPGADPDVFDLLRTDLFDHRWNNPDVDSRLDNVIDQHDVVVNGFGIDLVAYEGGQHVEGGSYAPNHAPAMYDLYVDYLEAMAPYFSVFVHYTNVAANSDTRSFGAKDATGQAVEDAPKYRALRDWIDGAIEPDPPAGDSILFDGAKVSFIANSYMGEWGGVNNYLELVAAADDDVELVTVPARQSAGGWYWGMGLAEMTDALDRVESEGDYDICVFLDGPLDAMRAFAQRLTAACGEVVLFVAGGGHNPASLGGSHSSSVASSLANARALEAEFPDLRVVPAALVFYDLAVNPPVAPPRLDYLYGDHNIHQNGLGTLVNAFALYAAMSGRSAVGVSFDYDGPAAADQKFAPGDTIGLGRPDPFGVPGDTLELTAQLRDALAARVDTLLAQWVDGATAFD